MARLERPLPSLVLAAVAVVYAPSLRGGFVWDDHGQVENRALLADPVRLLTTDIRGGEMPEDLPLYRPLVMLTHAGLQALHPGPGIERVANLALFLGVVTLVATLGRRLGAGATSAWLAALLFGVHTGPSETVAWITGRHDLLPAALTLAAWALMLADRLVPAGLLLALTPFAKESWLVVPVATLAWYPIARRRVWLPTALASCGVLACLAIRARVGEALGGEALSIDLLGVGGGTLARGVQLFLVPASADATPLATLQPVVGGIGLLVAIGLVAATVRLPHLCVLVATGLFLAPATVAAARFGIVADRYFLMPLSGVFIVSSLALDRLSTRWPIALVAAPLAWITAVRALEWREDFTLFSAAHARDPDNPHAQLTLGASLQEHHRCPEALPLLRSASASQPPARVRLQICLVETGQYASALAMADSLPGSTPARTTARAWVLSGDLAQGEVWARRATELRPSYPGNWTLLGQILGQRGDLDGAADAFSRALALDPANPDALAGMAAVERHRGSLAP